MSIVETVSEEAIKRPKRKKKEGKIMKLEDVLVVTSEHTTVKIVRENDVKTVIDCYDGKNSIDEKLNKEEAVKQFVENGELYIVIKENESEDMAEKGLTFASAGKMYDYICKEGDLYSKSLGIYAFVYNNAQAICIYNLQQDEVVKLIEKNKETNEYWGAHLGIGGSILEDPDYDDDEHRYNEDEAMRNLYLQPSIDFCEMHYKVEDWMDTKDVTAEYVLSEVKTFEEKTEKMLEKALSEKKMFDQATENIDDFTDKLGEIFFDIFNESDNNTADIGKYINRTLRECKTDREFQIANDMLRATCGYGIKHLIDRIEELDKNGHVWESIVD